MSQKLTTSPSDHFDPALYPQLEEELRKMHKLTDGMPAFFMLEMLLSFAKDGIIPTEWAQANPEVAEAISSGTVSLKETQTLFDSSKSTPVFRNELETYIANSFRVSTVTF